MGESFGRYELLERLGKGGMAEVHKARYAAAPGINKTVVVKRILADLAGQDDFRQMFVSEAKLTTRLSHGNVVQVFDAGEVNGELFLAMEWVDGVALDQLLEMARRKGLSGLPPELAALIAIDVLKGLHHAHTRMGEDGHPLKLVHRDISPENILVSYEGQVKVTDFGIAKASLAGRLETRPGIFKGKMSYGAPEQLRADPVDARADIYSVGLVLLEMVSGSNPVAQTAVQIASGVAEVPKLDEAFAGKELRDILATATHVKASSRYHNALAFQEALTQWAYPRAGSHAAGGLHHLMAWLFGAELRARGLYATVPENAERWLTTTRQQKAFKDSTAQAPPPTLDDVKLPPTDPSTPAAHHTLPDAQAPDFTQPGSTLPPQERATDRNRPPSAPPPPPQNEQTVPPKRGRSKSPVTRAAAIAVAAVLVALAWQVRQRWAQTEADDAACERAERAYAERDFATAQRELQPLLARQPPMARAASISKELAVETPAGEALTQAQKVLEAAAREHVTPDEAKLRPLLERASHTVRFRDEYQAIARGYQAATHVSADKLGLALAALDGNNFAEVLRNVPCLLAPCSNDWLKEQLTQERQFRTLLDQAEKLISAHDFKQAEDLLQATGRTVYQAERRKDLMLRLEGDEQAFAALDHKARPRPVPQPASEPKPFRQDLVLLEAAKSAISVKDWAKARSMLHDCLVIAPKQTECARLMQTVP